MTSTQASSLLPKALQSLPLGQVRPAGWLKGQLELQASGLSGHLGEFWPDIKDSAWIGGQAEGWERGPYWLDGLVPLAFLLNSPRLKGSTRQADAHRTPPARVGLEKNAAAPRSLVTSAEPPETLIPYGCTNLRVAAFPLLAGSEDVRTGS